MLNNTTSSKMDNNVSWNTVAYSLTDLYSPYSNKVTDCIDMGIQEFKNGNIFGKTVPF